jgi:hypothetical protein
MTITSKSWPDPFRRLRANLTKPVHQARNVADTHGSFDVRSPAPGDKDVISHVDLLRFLPTGEETIKGRLTTPAPLLREDN